MTDKPMTEDERVVREAWFDVSMQEDHNWIQIYANNPFEIVATFKLSPDRPWEEVLALAAEFTRNRQREIADVEGEIALLKKVETSDTTLGQALSDARTLHRTAARLQGVLIEKKRGMK